MVCLGNFLILLSNAQKRGWGKKLLPFISLSLEIENMILGMCSMCWIQVTCNRGAYHHLDYTFKMHYNLSILLRTTLKGC
jgi:hypothetical protein